MRLAARCACFRRSRSRASMKWHNCSGTGATLRSRSRPKQLLLSEEVGVDATRYFLVARAATSHLHSDYDLALERSSSNPVYYAQYAHARLCKLLETGAD